MESFLTDISPTKIETILGTFPFRMNKKWDLYFGAMRLNRWYVLNCLVANF